MISTSFLVTAANFFESQASDPPPPPPSRADRAAPLSPPAHDSRYP